VEVVVAVEVVVVAAALLLPADSAWLHVPDWVWVVQR